jgi:hypothetical protein
LPFAGATKFDTSIPTDAVSGKDQDTTTTTNGASSQAAGTQLPATPATSISERPPSAAAAPSRSSVAGALKAGAARVSSVAASVTSTAGGVAGKLSSKPTAAATAGEPCWHFTFMRHLAMFILLVASACAETTAGTCCGAAECLPADTDTRQTAARRQFDVIMDVDSCSLY